MCSYLSSFGVSIDSPQEFQSAIISWHKSNGRNYLWRVSSDSYTVLVAEIILRMTGAWKAEEVILDVLRKYPKPENLALADPSDLLPLFQPLGLFKRSRLLVEIAQEVVERFSGKFPTTYDELVSIKGIGQYTANAILCFALNDPAPLVDGSVLRVFQRCLSYKTDKPPYADKKIWELASALLPNKDYKDYNYGLLDLGSLVCSYSKPDHEACPLKPICFSIISTA